jgi:hypothetical protein
MRIPALLLAALSAAPPILAAQAPADPLPLRLGGVDVTGWVREQCSRDAANPEECTRYPTVASIPGVPALLTVDGRRVPASMAQANLMLVGEIGTPVTLGYRTADGVRTVRLVRSDVYAPGRGFTGLLRTAHFVVHHRPADEQRARTVAGDAERAYSRSGLSSAVGGRRAHLWGLRDYPGVHLDRPYPGRWGAWATGRYDPFLEYGHVFTYLAYGVPGAGAHLEGAGWLDANTLHRTAVSELLGHTPWLDKRPLRGYSARGASLREYIRQRYGVARLRQIWSSDASFDDAVALVLGVSRARLEADWRRHIFSLGPDPSKTPTLPAIASAAMWGTLLLFAGLLVARHREVG